MKSRNLPKRQVGANARHVPEGPKKLFRDRKRRLLGGVSSGIAHYFGIDPLWVRLIVVLLAIGSWGIILLAYGVLWVALPESDTLEEDKHLKKMFRNPDDKIFGGVSSGIAAYFGVDVKVVRLLFILSIFLSGSGIIAYIILWIILPEAQTITEKVQMQGDPITLSNIESSIKESLNVRDGEENLFVKILLFPFRLIAVVIDGLAKALGPLMRFLVEAIRVIAGIFITFIGLTFTLSLVIAMGVLLGVLTKGVFVMGDFPIPAEYLQGVIPILPSIAGFCFLVIPAFLVILLGVGIVAKRRPINATVGWPLFALWIISIAVLAFTVPSFAYNFSKEGIHSTSSTYDLEDKTAVLTLREAGIENYDEVHLRIRGHQDGQFKLVKHFESQGSSRREAIQHAKNIVYNVSVEDSLFTFDSNLALKDGAKFRFQEVHMTLYVPYNQPFVMTESLKYILEGMDYRYGYRPVDFENHQWMFTQAGLECTTCDTDYFHKPTYKYNSGGKFSRKFDLKDFSGVEIGGIFEVDILRGDEYNITVYGREEQVDLTEVLLDGDRIRVEYKGDVPDLDNLRFQRIKAKVVLPELAYLQLSDAAKAYIRGFDQDQMYLDLKDAAYASADVDIKDIEITMEGTAELEIKGEGEELEATLKSVSKLDAYNYKVNHAEIKARGFSQAKVYATENLDI